MNKLSKRITHFIETIFLLLCKVIFVLILLLVIGIAYATILIAIEPRSIPILADYAEQKLNKQGFHAKIRNAKIRWHGAGKAVVLGLDGLKLNSKFDESYLRISSITLTFNIKDLFLLRFYPKKIFVINPELYIEQNNLTQKDTSQKTSRRIAEFIEVIQIATESNMPLTSIIVQNAKLLTNFQQKIALVASFKNLNIDFFDTDNAALIHLHPSEKNNLASGIDLRCKIYRNKSGGDCALEIASFNPSKIPYITDATEHLRGINANFMLFANLTINSESEINRVNFAINTNHILINDKRLFADRLSFSNFKIVGSFINPFTNPIIEIKNISGDFGMTHLNASGVASKAKHLANNHEIFEKGLELKLILKASMIDADRIIKLWPRFLPEQSIKDWFSDSVTSILVKNARLAMTIDCSQEFLCTTTTLSGNARFRDLDLDYTNDLPPLFNAIGNIDFNLNQIAIKLDNAMSGENEISSASAIIDLSSAPVILKGLINTNGSIRTVMEYFGGGNSDIKFFTPILDSNITSHLEFAIPVKTNLAIADIAFTNHSDISFKEYQPILLPNSFASLKLSKPADSNMINGNLSLDQSAIEIKQLAFEKKIGEGGNVNFKLNLENRSLVGDIALGGISSQMIIKFQNGSLKTILFDDLKYLKNLLNINYHINDSVIDILAHNIDLTPYLQISTELGKIEFEQEFSVNFYADHVMMLHNYTADAAQMNIKCGHNICNSGVGSAKMSDGSQIFAKLSPAGNGAAHLNVDIGNLGTIANAIGVFDRMEGGHASVSGLITNENGMIDLSGKLQVTEPFKILVNPLFAELLSFDRFKNISKDLDKLTGLKFDQMTGDFKLFNSMLRLTSINTSGAKLGITARGVINLRNNEIGLNGVAIPAYRYNSLFGLTQMPVVNLLFGGESGGLFGINYSVSGKADDPKIKVNPLSVLTPGFVRGVFNVFN